MRNLVWGIILVTIGTLLLLDNLEIVDFGEVVSHFWPLILILWGANILLRRKQHQTMASAHDQEQIENELIHESNIFGDTSVKVTSQTFKGGSISSVFGDSELDLSASVFADGEHELRLHSVFGNLFITLPKDAAVSVSGNSLFGDIVVLGQRKGGFASDIHYAPEQYDSAPKRLKISFSKVFGNLRIS